MGFFNDTNHRRVENMDQLLCHILKSARANRASADDLNAMLAPLTARLREGLADLGGTTDLAPQPASAPAAPAAPLTAGERAALALADRASLRDLIAALIGRLEAHADHLATAEARVPEAAE